MVSAVILSYNRCNEVLKTIDKLKALRLSLPFELEIIVVDNGSIDQTSAKVAEQHPDIILVSKKDNNGIAGWNEGFKIAKNKYLFVLDDDSHIHTGLIEAVNRLEKNPKIGILATQIVDEQLNMDANLDPKDAWQDGEELAGFIGCGAIIRKEVYDKIGGFAEWIYVYTHEFEYAIRCIDAGYKVIFCADCIVVHRVSNINRSNKRLRTYATRNELLIVHKYFSAAKKTYLKRVLINNLKFIKKEGIMTGYYIMKGFYKYLRMKSTVKITPVSDATQTFFAANFWSTKAIFNSNGKR